MSKKKRMLIILLCVLIVLGAVTAVLLLLPQQGGGDASSAASDSSITLINQSASDVKKVVIRNENGEFAVLVEKTDSGVKYSLEGVGEGVPLVQDNFTMPTTPSRTLVAQRDLGEDSNLAKYGLDDPAAVVTSTYADGTTNKVFVGDKVPGNTTYYVMLNDDAHIYSATISSAVLSAQPTDYIQLAILNEQQTDEEGQAITPTFGYLNFEGSHYPQPIVVKPNTQSVKADDSNPLHLAKYVITEPEPLAVRDLSDDLLPQLTALEATKALVIEPTEEQLKEYGFDAPQTILTYSIYDKDYKLVVGKNVTKDSYCVMREGIDVIYLVDRENAKWINTSVFELRHHLPFLINTGSFEKMTLTTGGKFYEFTQTREKDEEKSTEEETAYTYKTFYNGKELDADNATHFYQSFFSGQKEEPVTGEITGEVLARVEFTYFAEYKRANTVIEVVDAGNRRVSFRIDGHDTVLIKESWATKFIQDAEKLVTGQTVSPP